MLTNSISAQRLVFVLYFIYDNAQASEGSGIHHPCHLCSVMVCSRSVCDLHSMLTVAFPQACGKVKVASCVTVWSACFSSQVLAHKDWELLTLFSSAGLVACHIGCQKLHAKHERLWTVWGHICRFSTVLKLNSHQSHVWSSIFTIQKSKISLSKILIFN